GVPRLQLKQADAALNLPRSLEQHARPKADWLVAVSNAWILKKRHGEAADAMQRAAVVSGKPDHLFRAARLWLQDDDPRKALPLLEQLEARLSLHRFISKRFKALLVSTKFVWV
ncbi:MAG: hypothetical protein GY859_41990, partial [Desulfobacterales bacterium]|nr:hypothetical protein [Desulfobacterales bacterium]